MNNINCFVRNVVQLMVDSLPNELTEPQRKKVRQLFQKNEAIFSKGEHDICRTIPNQYRNTSTSSAATSATPIQFKYLEVIDEQVEEMTKHGSRQRAPWLVTLC